MPRPYPVQLFDAVGPAIEWLASLGSIGGSPAKLLARIAALNDEAIRAMPLVGRLRVLLESKLDTADLAAAAKALGTSERSLQRRLREAETTFSAELGAARVRVAQRLLVASDEPLTAIALEVGCASLQHFGVLFRKATGRSPSVWRDAERARRERPRG